ncbi:MAG: DUF5684 domain-containing protein [Thermoleophilia bacterium]|nr:DUF5684 domain-containing protein [Thermoleophilia bacterium]
MNNSSGGSEYLIVLGLLLYAWLTYCLYRIALKVGMENAGIAFIPFFNMMLICAMIDKPAWYAILFLVPVINFFWSIIVWMRLSEEVGHSRWLGFAMILPLFNLAVPGYLAFSRE